MRHLLLLLVLASAASGFSGAGKESYTEALKYLGHGRATPEEQEAIRALSRSERLAKAVEHLTEAERQAATPQETEQVGRLLGNAYNDLALLQANDKDFRNAAYNMAEAIKRMPENNVLHWNLGNFQFSAGDYWEAAQSLAKARDTSQGEQKLQATRLLIQAYMKQAQSNDPNAYDYAIKEIQTALYDSPNDQDLIYLLGECHRLKGNDAEALKAWDQARTNGPLPAAWEQAYEKVKSASQIKAEQQFATESSLHFVLQFDDRSQGALARKMQDMLERAYDDIGAKFSMRPGHKVHVTVYTGDQFTDAVRIPWAGGVQQENKIDLRISAHGEDKEYENTIFHEYTHHLVALKAGQKHVPSWLNEGIAMHQEPQLGLARFTTLLNAVIKKKRSYIKFAKLSMGFTSLPTTNHVILAYAQSHSIVGTMIERFGFDSILKILSEMGTGQDFEGTFQRVTRVSWNEFERQWFEARLQAVDEGVRPSEPSFDGLEGKTRPTPVR